MTKCFQLSIKLLLGWRDCLIRIIRLLSFSIGIELELSPLVFARLVVYNWVHLQFIFATFPFLCVLAQVSLLTLVPEATVSVAYFSGKHF